MQIAASAPPISHNCAAAPSPGAPLRFVRHWRTTVLPGTSPSIRRLRSTACATLPQVAISFATPPLSRCRPHRRAFPPQAISNSCAAASMPSSATVKANSLAVVSGLSIRKDATTHPASLPSAVAVCAPKVSTWATGPLPSAGSSSAPSRCYRWLNLRKLPTTAASPPSRSTTSPSPISSPTSITTSTKSTPTTFSAAMPSVSIATHCTKVPCAASDLARFLPTAPSLVPTPTARNSSIPSISCLTTHSTGLPTV